MGGVADMITMMEEGGELGAQFGIHVNASEFYPEAKAFDDNRVGRYNNEDGTPVACATAGTGSTRA